MIIYKIIGFLIAASSIYRISYSNIGLIKRLILISLIVVAMRSIVLN